MRGAPDPRRVADLEHLQVRLGVVFPKYELLHQALMHRSFARERNLSSDNERLEFLGDAVLELVVSEHLYLHFPTASEGEMARLRSAVVSEPSLAAKARSLGLGKYLLLGYGEEHAGGRKLDSLLANALEAVIGAIHLEVDYAACQAFILNLFEHDVEALWKTKDFIDPKSALQEKVQQSSTITPTYEVYDEQGPDHDKVFHVVVKWQGDILGKGHGKTKKDAEQVAARDALHILLGRERLS